MCIFVLSLGSKNTEHKQDVTGRLDEELWCGDGYCGQSRWRGRTNVHGARKGRAGTHAGEVRGLVQLCHACVVLLLGGTCFRATLISHRLDFVEQWSSLARTHLLDWPAQLQRSVSLIPTLFVGILLDALFGMGDAVYLKSDCDVGVCVIIVVVCCPLASLHSLSS